MMVGPSMFSMIFGIKIEYDGTNDTLTFSDSKINLVMTYNSYTAIVNGKEVPVDVPFTIRAGRSHTPLRFILETFGATVSWDPVLHKATIVYEIPEEVFDIVCSTKINEKRELRTNRSLEPVYAIKNAPTLIINPVWEFTWKPTITISGKTDLDATITIVLENYAVEINPYFPKPTKAEIKPDQYGKFFKAFDLPLGKMVFFVVATNQRGDKSEEFLTITREEDFFIRLQIGSDKITNQFLTKKIELPPYIDPKTNRTFVPLRSIADAAVQEIKFDSKEQKIIIQNYGMRIDIVLWIGKPMALVNGIEKKIDDQLSLTPTVIKGRTFLPLRFLGESMNYKIIWNPTTQKIDMYFHGPIGIKEG
jgi:hypothetical protein